MALQKTEVIVLRSTPLGDADKIVTFYSPELGKLRGVAKGARRTKSPFGSSLEVLTHLQLLFFQSNSGLHRVSQTNLLDYFSALRQDLSQLTSTLYLVDLVYCLTPAEDANPALFELLLHTLKLLETGKTPFTLLRIFEIRLFALLGYAPQLECCVRCQKALDLKQKNLYNIIQGGLLCPDCGKGKSGLSLSIGSINFLKQAAKVDLTKISRLNLSAFQGQELEKMLQQHLRCHFQKEIKSYRFVEQL